MSNKTDDCKELEKRIWELEKTNSKLKKQLDNLNKDLYSNSDKIFQKIFESLPDVIWTMDLDFNFTYISPTTEKLLGYALNKRKRLVLTDIFSPETIALFKNKLSDQLKLHQSNPEADTSIKFESPAIHHSGEEIWIEIHTDFQKDDSNHIIGIQGVSRDITKRKEVEEKLKNSQEQIKLITDNVNEMLWMMNADFKYTYVSASCKRLHGYDPEEFMKLGLSDFMSDASYKKVKEAIHHRIENEKKGIRDTTSKSFETQSYHKDGHLIWVHVTTTPIYDGFGKFAGLTGISRDITELKKTEQGWKDTIDNFKYILKYDPNAIAVFDDNLNYIYVSDRYLGDYDVKEEDILGKHHYEVFPEVPERWREIHQRVLKGEILKNDDDSFQRPDGSITYNRWECRPWYKKDGSVGGMITYTEVTTERKQAELQLIESENNLRIITENSNDLISRFGPDGTFRYVSPSVEKILGFTPEEFKKKSYLIGVHAEDRTKIKSRFSKLLNNNKVETNVSRYYKKDGSIVWLETSPNVVYDREGNIHDIVTISRDVTDRIQADIKFKTLHSRYEAIATNFPNGAIFLFDKDLNYIFVAGKTLELVGLDPAKCIGKRVDQVFPPEISNIAIPNQKRIFEGERVYYEVVYKNRYYANWGEPIKSDNYNHHEGLVFAVDITDLKEKEDNLHQRNVFIQTVLDNLPIGLALNKINGGESTYINEKFEEIYGWPAKEITNIEDFFLKIYPDEKYREQMKNRIYSDISSGDPSRMHWENILITQKSQEQKIINAVNIPLTDQNTMVSTVLDITEQYQAKQELIKAKEKAEQSDRLKSAFLANMSHEIRTPMNGIIGFTELLNKDEIPPEKRKQYFKIIMDSSHQLLNIVNDILDISKLESGDTVLHYEAGSINDLLQDIHVFFSPKVHEKNLELQCYKDLTDNNSLITTDFTKLRQILNNLISNAIKFTHTGSITFGYQIDKDNLLFFVEDTGIGIPGELHEIIFERFRQADDTANRQYGGTGLGLSICKKLIELMGGSIWVESEVGTGSAFKFILPYTAVTRQMKHHDTKPTHVDELNENKTILIVEDEETNFIYLKELLDNEKIDLIHARNGQEGMDFCRNNPDISLVLMDIKMPVMDGYQATRKIKELRPNLPVIGQTAYAMAEDRKKAKDAGCDDYISKPINAKKLFKILKNYLLVK